MINLDGRDGSLTPAGQTVPFNAKARLLGLDQPVEALTAIGLVRLRTVRTLLEDAQAQGVAGDVVDIGVGRGGTLAYAAAVLASSGRRVRAFDTPATVAAARGRLLEAGFSLDGIEWTPPEAMPPVALLRLGTWTAPTTLDGLHRAYDSVAPGGFVMVDYYGRSPACRQAVDTFRRRAWVSAPLRDIDGSGVYWRKPKDDDAEPPPEPAPSISTLPVRSDPGPLFSVVIPVHDRARYFRQCLDSILGQAPPDGEILVCDDASTTVDFETLVRDLAGDRVRYIRRDHNLGQWENVNQALRESRGQWIHVLHDDDFVLPGFYRTMQDAIRQAPDSVGVVVCHCTNIIEDQGGQLFPLVDLRDSPGVVEDYLCRMITRSQVNVPAIVVRRKVYETVGVYDASFTCADWEFHIRSLTRYDWWYQPDDLARWRQHTGSFGQVRQANGVAASNYRRLYDTIERYLSPEVASRCLPAGRAVHAHLFVEQATHALEAGQLDLAVHLVREAARMRPQWA